MIASGVVNIISGIAIMNGVQYGEHSDYIYWVFEELKTLDFIYGICCILLGVFAIYVRMRLVSYYKNGPQMLNVFYIVNAAVGLVYVISVLTIIDRDVPITITSYFTSVGISVAMIAANTVYFKKRANLFTKD